MEIQQDEHGRKGAFFIEEDGEWIAELTYLRNDDSIVIDHTEVDPKLRNENIGRDLVDSAVKFARENGLKVGASCSYAQRLLETTPEYSDVFVASSSAAPPSA